jgi:diaminopimelate decarboxylase
MSVHTKCRRNLPYIDPATFTPHFSWKSTGAAAQEVFCEGVALSSIAKQFGTPAYVYSQKAIVDAYNELESGLKAVPHRLCFAVKANGNLSILKLLASRGSGFDIVSAGELDHLARISVPGNHIVFSGVGKTREEIREALRYKVKKSDHPGILQFNIESEAELEILLEESSRHAARVSKRLPGLSIRVNPDVNAGGHPHISTGRQHHKFGLGWPHARVLYLAHKDSKFIRWQGISAHIGSQITDLAPFRSALQRLGSYLTDLRKNGIALDYLDFGGGLGVRYTNEKPISRTAYARMVAKIARPLGVQLLLEPGRSIIAPACVLLSSVIASKHNSKKSFVILDAAMNDLIRPVLYDAPHPITTIKRPSRASDKSRQRVDIVGPVCETGDCFLENWPLDEVHSGDHVAIWATGAYGIVQSSNYTARPRPPEILINKRRSTLIRRRETRRDLLRTHLFPPR